MSNLKSFLNKSAVVVGLIAASLITLPLADASAQNRGKGKSKVTSGKIGKVIGNNRGIRAVGTNRGAGRTLTRFNNQRSQPAIRNSGPNRNAVRNRGGGNRNVVRNRGGGNRNAVRNDVGGNSPVIRNVVNRNAVRNNNRPLRVVGNNRSDRRAYNRGYNNGRAYNRGYYNGRAYNRGYNTRRAYNRGYNHGYSNSSGAFVTGLVGGAILSSAFNSYNYYDTHIGVSYSYGYPSYYGPNYYYGARYGYRPSTQVVYVQQPQQTVVQQVPVYTQQPASAPAYNYQPQSVDDDGCLQVREYTTTIEIGGETVPAYGQACLMPDGSWKFGDPIAERSF